MAESQAESRLDRELIELLNELRVMLPGVQVLFAFLLTVPFTSRFARVTDLQRSVYFLAFVTAALAAVLLVAPSTYHRMTFRQHDKEHLLQLSNRLALAASGFLAVAMGAAVFLIGDLLYRRGVAALTAAVVTAAAVLLWFAIPVRRRVEREKHS